MAKKNLTTDEQFEIYFSCVQGYRPIKDRKHEIELKRLVSQGNHAQLVLDAAANWDRKHEAAWGAWVCSRRTPKNRYWMWCSSEVDARRKHNGKAR